MIKFEEVSKIYDSHKIAVDKVNLTIEDGEFVVIIGTSGCGKTTCLRMINRMVNITEGKIWINGEDINQLDEVQLRRKIGYVIQEIGLMPHMTIYENIVIVPRLLKWSKEKQREVATRLIERVNLPQSTLDKYPSELSGGQQQRIGVIRALAADQDIILMDEPFGALDPITRKSLQKLIKELHQDLHKTFVFVTHDIDEALLLADKIVIMDKGKVVQMDTPDNILKYPANTFVETIVGQKRIKRAKFETQTAREAMYTNIIAIKENAIVQDALKKMIEHKMAYLYVTDAKEKLKGFVDIYTLSKVARKEEQVGKWTFETPSIHEKMRLKKALSDFTASGYKILPVVNGEGKLIGEITREYLDSLILETR